MQSQVLCSSKSDIDWASTPEQRQNWCRSSLWCPFLAALFICRKTGTPGTELVQCRSNLSARHCGSLGVHETQSCPHPMPAIKPPALALVHTCTVEGAWTCSVFLLTVVLLSSVFSSFKKLCAIFLPAGLQPVGLPTVAVCLRQDYWHCCSFPWQAAHMLVLQILWAPGQLHKALLCGPLSPSTPTHTYYGCVGVLMRGSRNRQVTYKVAFHEQE